MRHNRLRRLLTFVALTTTASALAQKDSFAIDNGITITSAADISTKRTALIQNAFGISTLPTTLPTVTTNVTNPLSLTNVQGVDQYVATMPNGQSNTSLFYRATNRLNRAVIFNPGHNGSCDWNTFSPSERIVPTLQALLTAGFDVYAMNMPGCGSLQAHHDLFSQYGDQAMRYFVEPAVQAMNYWVYNDAYYSFDVVGLSGGGWTATILGALDTRIQLSIPVAGTHPGVQFVSGASSSPDYADLGNAEQQSVNYYTIAGFLDHYIMGSYGLNRGEQQILNYNDNCCFGNNQWTAAGFNFQTYYGVNWVTYVDNWMVNIANTQNSIGNMKYNVFIDYQATAHQISQTFAQPVILSLLGRTSTECAGTWNINANGYPGTLTISNGVGGFFNGAVLKFNGYASESVSGVCVAGNIQFTRTGPSQVYTGSYTATLMSGTFSFQGSPSNWRATKPGVTTVDDNDPSITYSAGTWDTNGNPQCYAATRHIGNASGEYAQFTFTGTTVSLVATQNTDRGVAGIYIDGTLDANVDMYSSLAFQQTVYTKVGLTSGSHTIKVLRTGTKNVNSTDYKVEIDAFQYSSASTIDDANSSISYDPGSWFTSGNSNCYQSTRHIAFSDFIGATYTFTGTGVSLVTTKATNRGIAYIYIDDNFDTTVDLYGTLAFKQTVYSKAGLTPGSHKIGVYRFGVKNPSSSDYQVEVDAFQITP